MSTPEYYRAQAAQVRELAAKSRDPEAVGRWLQMALEYERLARKLTQDSRPAAKPRTERQPMQQQQSQIAPDDNE
jgi:hypothetical protein